MQPCRVTYKRSHSFVFRCNFCEMYPEHKKLCKGTNWGGRSSGKGIASVSVIREHVRSRVSTLSLFVFS